MAWTKVTMIEEQFGDEIGMRLAGLVIGTKANGQRKWYCQSDAVADSNDALSASAGGVSVAAMGESFSASRTSCRCRSRKVERLTPYQFHVTAEYHDPTDGSSYEDLLDQPARVSSTDEQFSEGYSEDHSDPVQIVRNTAGEPYDQLPERLAGIRVYTIRKYVDADTKADIQAAVLTINENAETIDGFLHPIGTLLLASGSFEPVDDFYEATLIVKYNGNKWIDRVPSFGFSEKDGDNRIPIKEKIDPAGPDTDANKQPVARPWPLNEDGSAGTGPTATPFVQQYQPYPTDAWSGVPLS